MAFRAYRRAAYHRHPETKRRYDLKKYGLTPEKYDQMLKTQRGVCNICHRPMKSGRCPTVDHDHKTKRVRGLLCVNCNTHVGWLEKFDKEIAHHMLHVCGTGYE